MELTPRFGTFRSQSGLIDSSAAHLTDQKPKPILSGQSKVIFLTPSLQKGSKNKIKTLRKGLCYPLKIQLFFSA